MMLAPNPATFARKSHILFRQAAFFRTPTGYLKTQRCLSNPIQMNRSFTSSESRISLPSAIGVRGFSCPQFGLQKLSLRSLRVSSGDGGGAGGSGGSGNGGGSGSGGGGGGDGGNSWSLLSWYLSLLAKHPVVTKAITSALLTLIGDLVCQLAVDQVPSLDFKRTFIFTLLGLALVGPTLHFWYFYLSKLVTIPGASGAILRLFLDQFFFAPAFIGVFMSTLVTLEGKPSNVIPMLQQEWFSSVLVNWQLWIPFQFFNFRFVPQQFQVLAANCVALIWNTILSYKSHKEVITK